MFYFKDKKPTTSIRNVTSSDHDMESKFGPPDREGRICSSESAWWRQKPTTYVMILVVWVVIESRPDLPDSGRPNARFNLRPTAGDTHFSHLGVVGERLYIHTDHLLKTKIRLLFLVSTSRLDPRMVWLESLPST